MKRAALFIGVNRYDDPEINNLDCAEYDATELYGFFKHRAGYDDVRNLLSPDSDLLLDTAHDMAAGLAPDDLFLLFFAGHGVEYEGRHLLLCPKARYSRLKYHQHAVPLDLIKQETTRKGLHRILILDACRTDLLRGERGGGAGLRDVKCLREMVSAEPAGGGSLAIICSCDEGQQSREIAQCRQGVFSLALLQTLQERLENGDAVTLSDQVEEILSQKMAALARNYGFTIDQRPWIQKSGATPALVAPSSRLGEITSEPIAETPPVTQIIPVKNKKIPKQPSEDTSIPTADKEKSAHLSPALLEFRERVLGNRIQRIKRLAFDALFCLDNLEKPTDKDQAVSLLEHSTKAMALSPNWHFCVFLDLNRIVRIHLFKQLPDAVEGRFSRMDGAKEIQRGPVKYSYGSVEDKTSFFLRAAYIYALIFKERNKTAEALERASRSADSVYDATNIALAFYDLLGDGNKAARLWQDAYAKAASASEYVTLAQYTCVLPSDKIDPDDLLKKAERLAKAKSDFIDVAEGYFRITGDVAASKRMLEKAITRLETGDLIFMADLIKNFYDAGDFQFATSVIEKFESIGFPDTLPGFHAMQLALLWFDNLDNTNRAVSVLRKAEDFIKRAEGNNKGIFDDISWGYLGQAYFFMGEQKKGRELFRYVASRITSDIERKTLEKKLRSCREDPEEYIR
ncbi:MAG: caspase family protein [Thermodesulfobacteriota bacterium]